MTYYSTRIPTQQPSTPGTFALDAPEAAPADAITLSVNRALWSLPGGAAEKKQQAARAADNWQRVTMTPDALRKHVAAGRAIGPVLRDGKRNKAHFESCQLIVLDLDDGPDVATTLQHPFVARHRCIAGPSPSSTPEHPKTRVLFPLAAPVTDYAAYKQLARWVLAQVEDLNPDPSSDSAARFYFGCQDAFYQDGALLPSAAPTSSAAERPGPAGQLSGYAERSTPNPNTRHPETRLAGGLTAYAAAALDYEVRRVASAAVGNRNNSLNAAAFNLGQLVAGGALPAALVEADLLSAATTAGLPDGEALRTFNSGFTAGQEQPRAVPQQQRAYAPPDAPPPFEIITTEPPPLHYWRGPLPAPLVDVLLNLRIDYPSHKTDYAPALVVLDVVNAALNADPAAAERPFTLADVQGWANAQGRAWSDHTLRKGLAQAVEGGFFEFDRIRDSIGSNAEKPPHEGGRPATAYRVRPLPAALSDFRHKLALLENEKHHSAPDGAVIPAVASEDLTGLSPDENADLNRARHGLYDAHDTDRRAALVAYRGAVTRLASKLNHDSLVAAPRRKLPDGDYTNVIALREALLLETFYEGRQQKAAVSARAVGATVATYRRMRERLGIAADEQYQEFEIVPDADPLAQIQDATYRGAVSRGWGVELVSENGAAMPVYAPPGDYQQAAAELSVFCQQEARAGYRVTAKIQIASRERWATEEEITQRDAKRQQQAAERARQQAAPALPVEDFPPDEAPQEAPPLTYSDGYRVKQAMFSLPPGRFEAVTVRREVDATTGQVYRGDVLRDRTTRRLYTPSEAWRLALTVARTGNLPEVTQDKNGPQARRPRHAETGPENTSAIADTAPAALPASYENMPPGMDGLPQITDRYALPSNGAYNHVPFNPYSPDRIEAARRFTEKANAEKAARRAAVMAAYATA